MLVVFREKVDAQLLPYSLLTTTTTTTEKKSPTQGAKKHHCVCVYVSGHLDCEEKRHYFPIFNTNT